MSKIRKTNTKRVKRAVKRTHVFVRQGKKAVTHPRATLQSHPQQTAHFKVSVDPGLGQAGSTIADGLLETCEQDYVTLQGYFGGITPKFLPFHLIVTSGSDGASHATCRATALSIGAKSGPVPFMRSLVIAEEDEVFEANFGHGWNCGFSNGEGLSRVLANDMVPGVEPSDFVSAPVWLDDQPKRRRSPRRLDKQDGADRPKLFFDRMFRPLSKLAEIPIEICLDSDYRRRSANAGWHL